MSTDPIPTIDAAVLAQAYAEARRCYPAEACGLLLGPRDAARCDEARLCPNQQDMLHARDPETFPRDARTAYTLAGKDVLWMNRSLDGERPVKIIFHSHVEVGAYFSAEDQRAATQDGEPVYPVDYLVIDCAQAPQGQPMVRGARLFRFRDGAFVAIASYAGESC